MMQSKGAYEPDEDQLEDAVAFVGVARFPARVKCALLGWSAFKDAVLRAGVQETARREHERDREAPRPYAPRTWSTTSCPTSTPR